MSRVLRNFAWLSAGSVASQALGALALIVVSRRLGPATFGLLAFAQAIANLGITVADMGLGRLGTRMIASGTRPRCGLDIVALRSAVNLLCVAVIGAACIAFHVLAAQGRLILFCALATMGLALAPDFVWTGLQTMRTYSVVQAGQQALRGLMTAGLVLWTGSAVSVPIASLVAGLTGAVLLWKQVPNENRAARLEPGKWLSWLWSALPIGIASMMPDIYINSDSLMVRGFLGLKALGEYAAAYRLLLIVLTVGGLFVASLFPEICRIVRPRGDESSATRLSGMVSRALLICISACLPLALLSVFLPNAIVGLIYGASYQGGGSAVRFLLMVPLVALPNLVLSAVLIARGDARFNLLAIAGGGLVNLGLDAALVTRIGIAGAGLATVVAEMLVLGALFVRVRPGIRKSEIAELIVAGSGFVATLMLVQSASAVLAVILAAIVYCLCLCRSEMGGELRRRLWPVSRVTVNA